jgi:hypothetical protein
VDILTELERLLADTPETAYAVPMQRRLVAAAVREIKRLRALNAGLVQQLNGERVQVE